jgi:hypothetical protein
MEEKIAALEPLIFAHAVEGRANSAILGGELMRRPASKRPRDVAGLFLRDGRVMLCGLRDIAGWRSGK